MSSDDSGFDKEAEREKLREKYGDEDEDRENTRRMSELLLQGATMTGKHCNECGDPIFRYDGQEFCPTCQHEAGAGQAGGESEQSQQDQSSQGQSPQDQSPQEAAEADAGEQGANADRATDRGAETDDEPRVEIDGVRVADRHADTANVRRPPSQQDRSADRQSADRTARNRRRASAGDRGPETTERRPADGTRRRAHAGGRAPGASEPTAPADDLATARESLVRKLTDLARRAEETDDVARARELLAATREAAEALSALDDTVRRGDGR